MSRPTIQVPGSQILTNQETDNLMTSREGLSDPGPGLTVSGELSVENRKLLERQLGIFWQTFFYTRGALTDASIDRLLNEARSDGASSRDHEKPPVEAWKPDREAVARIIDPWSFKQCEWATEADDDEVLRRFIPHRDLALARADLVLALPSQPVVGGSHE